MPTWIPKYLCLNLKMSSSYSMHIKENNTWRTTKSFFFEARKVSQEKMSLIIVKDPKRNTLNIAMTDGKKVSEIKIKMD